MDNKELFEKAIEARDKAYAPYSKFRVGAAVLTGSGNVYTGVNIENSVYPAGTCAERTACSNAVSAGEKDFKAVAIAGAGEEKELKPCWPCGICRQFMYEFSPEIKVITGTDVDSLKIKKLTELIPESFSLY